MRRVTAALCCLLLVLGSVVQTAARADAAPLPASYGGTAGGDVASVGLSLTTLTLAGVRLADSNAQVDSGATPRSSATSRNLGASVAGLPVNVDQQRQTAPPDNTASTGTQSLADISALGITASTLTSNNHARWTGDSSCFSGDLANSYVATQGIGVNPVGLANLLSLGVSNTRGTTGLVTTSGLNKAVRSQASGSVADLKVLSNLEIAITGASTLGLTADGSTQAATADYNPGTITYTRTGQNPVSGTVTATSSPTITVGGASVTLRANTPTTSGTGRSATASVPGVLTITVTSGLSTASINILPLSVSAAAPAGGIDCAPDAPTVSAPANGSRTNASTPAFAGTGRPGATVNLTLDSGTPRTGVAVVDGNGNWTYTPTSAIADGAHQVSVTQTVNGATSASSNTNSFTIDTSPPGAPTLSTPTNSSLTATSRPTFTGTAEANSTVRVYVDGSSIGTTTASGSGAFSLVAPADIADGSHTAYVRATDQAGNTSTNSNTNTFRIDATAPAAPVVTTPADGSSTRDTTPVLAGTAEASADVTVFVDGTALAGTVTANASGNWQTTSLALAEGSHTVRARATDSAGNTSGTSATTTFTVDRTAPAAPVIASPADGSRTNNATPTLTGTGEAGARVSVQIDGSTVGTVTVGAGGSWSLPTSAVLTEGNHQVSAVQTDPAGNVSGSASNSFTVDTTAPAAPVITGPAANSVHRGPAVAVSGTGEPGARVVVTDSLRGSLGAVTVSPAGTWTVQDTALADGIHTVTAVQTDGAGNGSTVSNAVAFRVSSTAPAAPVITVPATNSALRSQAVTIGGTGIAGAQVVLTDGTGRSYPSPTVAPDRTWTLGVTLPDGVYTVSATQDEGAGPSASSNSITFTVDTVAPSAPTIVAPANGALVRDTTPRISGTGEPGALVTVGLDGAALGSVRVAGDGSWSIAVTDTLAQGSHPITAVQTDAAGNQSAAASSAFTVDTVAPATPVITAPQNNAVIAATTPEVRGTGTAGDRIQVSIDAGVAQVATVQPDGTWSITSATTLGEGTHTASVVEIDPAGNASGAAEVGFRVDTTAPAAPVVTTPADGSRTNDPRPTFSGTAEAGSSVVVSLNGNEIGTVTAAGGSWSLVGGPLTDGTYTLTAVARDAAGNVSAGSNASTFTVDLTAPAAPVITAPANQARIADRTPTISGTGESGARLSVDVDGQSLGTVTVTAGNWSVPDSDPLGQGSHLVTAVQTDAAGNISARTYSTFTVDTVRPSAPVITAPSEGVTVTGPALTVSGSGEPGAQLVLTINQSAQPAVTVDQDGAWAVSLTGVADGPKTVVAVQTDVAGNVSDPSEGRNFTVGSNAPPAPVISSPTPAQLINDNTPTVSGTGIDSAVVTVRVDGVIVGDDVVVNSRWSVTVGDALADGSHLVTAVQTVGIVNSAESAGVSFRIDATAPAAPVINSPSDGAVINNSTPTISGSGENGAQVQVVLDGQPLGVATVSGGTWSVSVPAGSPLGNSTHTVTATQTDAAGNRSPQVSNSFTVDRIAPSAPVIASPAAGVTLAGPDVTVSGTGEAGDQLVLSVNGTAQAPVTVAANGSWSVALIGLITGSYDISAVQTDPATNSSVAATSSFAIDRQSPSAPVISTPADGSLTAVSAPTVTGSGEAGATVSLVADGDTANPRTTTVAGNGSWTIVLPVLPDGEHTLAATQADQVGNVSARSALITFTIDSTAPSAPVVRAPADGSVINNATPTLSGTATSGVTVEVFLNGVSVGTTTATTNNTWALVSAPLTAGSYVLSARARDAAGNQSAVSNSDTFTVDLSAPAAPVITAPANGSSTQDSTPAIRGTGEAGARVQIVIDGQPAGSVLVDTDGNWTFTPGSPLSQGGHQILARQTDPAGNGSADSSPTSFAVDSVAPGAPVISAPSQGATVTGPAVTVSGSGEVAAQLVLSVNGVARPAVTVAPDASWTVALTGLADGAYTLSAVQTDAAGNASDRSAPRDVTVGANVPAAPAITAPTSGQVIASTQPTITGTGIDGASVTVRVDGAVVGTATVVGGRWSVTPSSPLADRAHVATAVQTVAGTDSAESAPVSFSTDTTAPAAPVITAPADGAISNDTRPNIAGTGETGATVNVSINGASVGTTTVDQNGDWTFTPPDALQPGQYEITARQSDPVGNLSSASATTTITIDTSAPAAPVITAPTDGATVLGPDVAVSGTGEAGATLVLRVDGSDQPSVTVASDRTWTVSLTGLTSGTYYLTAVQSDRAGNGSDRTSTRSFTINPAAPAAPAISTPADGAVLSNATPTITGTGIDGAVVTVRADGRTLGTAVVSNGRWSLDVSPALSDGQHTFTALQSVAGVDSAESSPVQVTVDATAPLAPEITTPVDGSILNQSRPTVTGTGEAGAVVDVIIDQDSAGTTQVGQNGSWTFVPDEPLGPGAHTIAATQTDAVGNTSVATDPITITIDTTAPSRPVIITPANGSTTGATPTVTGTGENGAQVVVVLDGVELGTTTVSGGTWSQPISAALSPGSHTVRATQTDPAGNVSAAASTTFTVDTDVPAAPVISAPTQDATVVGPDVTVTGTGEPGAELVLSLNGSVRPAVTVEQNGSWSVSLTGLDDGSYSVSAVQTDAAGNPSETSAVRDFIVRAAAPAAPVITAPANGSLIADPNAVISGTGAEGAVVGVFVDGESVGTATVTNGSWSLIPSSPLSDRTHVLTAIQRLAGVDSAESSPVTITVDTAAAAPVIDDPEAGTLTSNPTPNVAGSAEPGATVSVIIDGDTANPVITTADQDGRWSVTLPTQSTGPHTVKATQTDRAGNVSAASATVDFTVDASAPAAPVISSPADGSSVGSSTPTVSGEGEPGATVSVIVDDDTANPISTTVAQNGTWSLTLPALSASTHTVLATQTDPAGNTSARSGSVTFTIDRTAPAAPVIGAPIEGSTVQGPNVTVTGGGEVGASLVLTVDGVARPAVLVDQLGRWTVQLSGLANAIHVVSATQTDPVGNVSSATADRSFRVNSVPATAAPVISRPVANTQTAIRRPVISGTGEVGAVITVIIDQNLAGTTTVDPNGNWTFTPGADLTLANHTVVATQQLAGQSSSPQSAPVTFTVVAATAPAAPVIINPLNGSLTSDNTPAVTGTGVPGDVVTVTIDNVVVGSTMVRGNGSWSLTLTRALRDGAHVVGASQAADGGPSSPSALTHRFSVDTVVATPVITTPTEATVTVDRTPTVTGKGEAGATVTVRVDGRAVGTAVVAGNGTWTFTLPTQSVAAHVITATQTDPAGNVSEATAPVKITVANLVPPKITKPTNGSATTSRRPVVSGTGVPGSRVSVTIVAGPAKGASLGTVTVKADGTWSLTPAQNLVAGTYTFGATQRVAGSADLKSNQVTVALSYLPGAPTGLSVRAGDRRLDLQFSAPSDNGGKSISGYQVSIDGGAHWSKLTIKNGKPITASVLGVLNGATYPVRVRAVNGNGAGAATATVSTKVPAWFADPISKSDRAKEVAVPKKPSSYKGKVTHTTATNRSHNGTIAYPAAKLKGRQLQPKQAVELGGTALFDFNSAKLTAGGKKAITSLASSLRYTTAVTCEGYSDFGGTSKNESALAKARAATVCAQLKSDAKQLTSRKVIGYSSSYPVLIGGKPSDRAANRRVVVVIDK